MDAVPGTGETRIAPGTPRPGHDRTSPPETRFTMPKNKPTTGPATTTQPLAPALPPAALRVLGLLSAESPATAAELAESASLGRSTVTKALSILLDAGMAARQDGGHEGSRRIADRWFAVSGEIAETPAASGDAEPQTVTDDNPQAGAVKAIAEKADDPTGETFPEAEVVADDEPPLQSATSHDILILQDEPVAAGSGHPEAAAEPEPDDDRTNGLAADNAPDGEARHDEPSAKEPSDTEAGQPQEVGDAHSESVPGADSPEVERADDLTEQAAPGSDAEPEAPEAEHDSNLPNAAADGPGKPDAVEELESASAREAAEAETPARLGKGELRARVEAHLREHSDQTWTPSAIAKVLNRSAGAIANACEKLLETEAVTTFEDKPRRFQWRNEAGATAS